MTIEREIEVIFYSNNIFGNWWVESQGSLLSLAGLSWYIHDNQKHIPIQTLDSFDNLLSIIVDYYQNGLRA